ncbi:hypothetical protein [Cryobacterium sp. PH31-L1]|uniref:hypothetical protein n=1 Tax=Cryobacterium sp. PH31-L1 TaxID=3046199 RepID=UPI0024B97419|nr:hypothetical protein [Cryobacterium sp. PH31-L1]MDJ0378238.1 hypothetical protein [Cryobacterium sp. PH31-L1]
MKLTAPPVTATTRTAPIRTFATLGAFVLLVALSGCAAADSGTGSPASAAATAAPTAEADASGDCTGITVVVDFGTLDADTVTDCVDATDPIAASAALTSTGVSTEGSVEYGDAIVCRVNDRPAADETVVVDGQASFTETCASMPPAYAYWALWVKATPGADWDYAMEGLGTLEVEPGQSLGLVYTTGTETPTPGS